jgi:hypothetical protein
MRGVISLAMPLSAMVLIASCAGKSESVSSRAITAEQLTAAESGFLKEKQVIDTGEKLVVLYTARGVKKDGVLLTDKKVLSYKGDAVKKAAFPDIYDLSIDYADSAGQPSVVTVYRKDNTDFTCEVFAGTTQLDQDFYNRLLGSWQQQRATQASVPAAGDTSGSQTFGVKLGSKDGKAAGLAGPGKTAPPTMGDGK